MVKILEEHKKATWNKTKIGFYFTPEHSWVSAKREDLQGIAWYTPPLLLWFVVVLITKPEIHLSPATFTKFAESLNSSVSQYNLLHFSLEQEKGGVINQEQRTYDCSGTRGAPICIRANFKRYDQPDTSDIILKVWQRRSSEKSRSYLPGWKPFPKLIWMGSWCFLICTFRNHTSEDSFTPMQPLLNLPFHFLMKNLLMSDESLEAAVLFLIWLRSLACVAVLCRGEKGAWRKS